MALKPGDKVYVIMHPYYHYLAEVVEVLGVRRAALRNVVQIHSDSRGWTTFFAKGVTKETNYDIIGEAPDVSYLGCFKWPHAIPTEKRK